MKNHFPTPPRKKAAEIRVYLCAHLGVPCEPLTSQDAADLAAIEIFCAQWEGHNASEYHAVISALSLHIWDSIRSGNFPIVTQEGFDQIAGSVGPNKARVGLLANGLFPRHDPERGAAYWTSAPRAVSSFAAQVIEGWELYRWNGSRLVLN